MLWFLAYDVRGSASHDIAERRRIAGSQVKEWQKDLKEKGGFRVDQSVLDAARQDFASEHVSDPETLITIRDVYLSRNSCTVDPHSAVGITAALRSSEAAPYVYHVALATAHPAKFSSAVELALKDEKAFRFEDILPEAFKGLEELPKRITHVKKSGGIEGIRMLIVDRVRNERGIT